MRDDYWLLLLFVGLILCCRLAGGQKGEWLVKWEGLEAGKWKLVEPLVRVAELCQCCPTNEEMKKVGSV